MSAASYYEQSNDGLQSAKAHANVLAGFIYGYSDKPGESILYEDLNKFERNWEWILLLLVFGPCIIYKCCCKKAQQQEGQTTNIDYNNNNFERAPDGTVQQKYYN